MHLQPTHTGIPENENKEISEISELLREEEFFLLVVCVFFYSRDHKNGLFLLLKCLQNTLTPCQFDFNGSYRITIVYLYFPPIRHFRVWHSNPLLLTSQETFVVQVHRKEPSWVYDQWVNASSDWTLKCLNYSTFALKI